jgi:hypothetical protein
LYILKKIDISNTWALFGHDFFSPSSTYQGFSRQRLCNFKNLSTFEGIIHSFPVLLFYLRTLEFMNFVWRF